MKHILIGAAVAVAILTGSARAEIPLVTSACNVPPSSASQVGLSQAFLADAATGALCVQQGDLTGTGTLASGTLNAVVPVTLNGGRGSVDWQITGLAASGATVTPEYSDDGLAWFGSTVIAGGAPVMVLTADGTVAQDASRHAKVRLRVSTAAGSASIGVVWIATANSQDPLQRNAIGTQADAAWSGSGNSTVVAALKAIWTRFGSLTVTTTPSAAVVQTFTRPANTTAYTAGQAVCTSTSVDCTPLNFIIGAKAGGAGLIHGVQLTKSATSVTNASFTIEIYQTTPTVTGIHDASAYSPKLADINSGAWRGQATCTAATVNGDNAAYQCQIGNPNGMIVFVSDASSKVYAVIQANGAYTPASAETFTVSLSALRD